jgi:hypothetical protein
MINFYIFRNFDALALLVLNYCKNNNLIFNTIKTNILMSIKNNPIKETLYWVALPRIWRWIPRTLRHIADVFWWCQHFFVVCLKFILFYTVFFKTVLSILSSIVVLCIGFIIILKLLFILGFFLLVNYYSCLSFSACFSVDFLYLISPFSLFLVLFLFDLCLFLFLFRFIDFYYSISLSLLSFSFKHCLLAADRSFFFLVGI